MPELSTAFLLAPSDQTDPRKEVNWFARRHQTAVQPFLMPACLVKLKCVLISKKQRCKHVQEGNYVVFGYGRLCHTL